MLPNRICISYYPLDCQLIGNKDIKHVPYQPNPAHTSMTYFPCQTGHIFVDWVLVLCLNECKKLPLKKSGNWEFFVFFVISQLAGLTTTCLPKSLWWSLRKPGKKSKYALSRFFAGRRLGVGWWGWQKSNRPLQSSVNTVSVQTFF